MNNQIGEMIILESPYNNLVEIKGEKVYLTSASIQKEDHVKHFGAKKDGDIIFMGMIVGTGERVYYYLDVDQEIKDNLNQEYWRNLARIIVPLRFVPGNHRALGYKIDTKKSDEIRLVVDNEL